jgi:hypothetical protein
MPYGEFANEQRTARCGDGLPMTGGFASLQPEDADYAIEVFREAELRMRSHVREIRSEPEHYVRPKRPRPPNDDDQSA